jgi:Winged helix DNA-binding domain
MAARWFCGILLKISSGHLSVSEFRFRKNPMQEQQLQELRREKWRLNGRPVCTLEEAREYIESVGFCLLYPQRPPVLAPTFVGAYKGSDEKLPTVQMAFADAGARDAKDLMVRLLREKAAYEANVFPENNFIVSASVFPYFYGLVGDRNPRQPPKAGARSEYSPLAVDAFHIIQKDGPISKYRVRELLGGDISEAALDRALDELWAKLRITRVDYKQDEGVFWDVLFRWAPQAVRQGMHVSFAEALTALVSKYLDCVLAAQQEEVEQFFSPIIGRVRVREGIHALQAARELTYVHVAGRVMLQVSSPQPPHSADHEFKPKPRFEPLPPRPGMPLVERRPSKRAGRSKPPAPRQGNG